MLNEEFILTAFSRVSDGYVEETRRALGYETAHRRIGRTAWKIILAAAIIISLLTVTAFAAGWFGIKAVQIENDNLTPYKYEIQSDGTSAYVENPKGAFVSITQPQDVPEEISPEVRAKIDNSKAAWEEWSEWKSGKFPINPYESIEPAEALSCDAEDNGDGTYTLIYYLGNNKHEEHVVSAESWQCFIDFVHLMGQGGIDGYDHKYGVYSNEMAEKLEEIASKYGLAVRHNCTQIFQNLNGYEEGLTFDEMTAVVNEICGNGHFFNIAPTGYDKFYYFDEGTFAVSFYITENLSNTGTSCYLYNSPYDTLSSGLEVFTQIDDVNSVNERCYVSKDGTKLTVLRCNNKIFAYSYLDESFVSMEFFSPSPLADEEINAIIDMVDYGSIRHS